MSAPPPFLPSPYPSHGSPHSLPTLLGSDGPLDLRPDGSVIVTVQGKRYFVTAGQRKFTHIGATHEMIIDAAKRAIAKAIQPVHGAYPSQVGYPTHGGYSTPSMHPASYYPSPMMYPSPMSPSSPFYSTTQTAMNQLPPYTPSSSVMLPPAPPSHYQPSYSPHSTQPSPHPASHETYRYPSSSSSSSTYDPSQYPSLGEQYFPDVEYQDYYPVPHPSRMPPSDHFHPHPSRMPDKNDSAQKIDEPTLVVPNMESWILNNVQDKFSRSVREIENEHADGETPWQRINGLTSMSPLTTNERTYLPIALAMREIPEGTPTTQTQEIHRQLVMQVEDRVKQIFSDALNSEIQMQIADLERDDKSKLTGSDRTDQEEVFQKIITDITNKFQTTTPGSSTGGTSDTYLIENRKIRGSVSPLLKPTELKARIRDLLTEGTEPRLPTRSTSSSSSSSSSSRSTAPPPPKGLAIPSKGENKLELPGRSKNFVEDLKILIEEAMAAITVGTNWERIEALTQAGSNPGELRAVTSVYDGLRVRLSEPEKQKVEEYVRTEVIRGAVRRFENDLNSYIDQKIILPRTRDGRGYTILDDLVSTDTSRATTERKDNDISTILREVRARFSREHVAVQGANIDDPVAVTNPEFREQIFNDIYLGPSTLRVRLKERCEEYTRLETIALGNVRAEVGSSWFGLVGGTPGVTIDQARIAAYRDAKVRMPPPTP